MFVSSTASESKLTIGADSCVVELGIVKDRLYWPLSVPIGDSEYDDYSFPTIIESTPLT